MNIKDLLDKNSVILNNHSSSKEEVIDLLVEKHFECEHIIDKEIYKQAILAREELSSTGVGGMIAIPHAQDDTVKYPSLVALVNQEGVDFDSLDQKPAKLFFMIAVPKDGGSQHLEILAKLCQILMDEETVEQLLLCQNEKDFINILCGEMENNDEDATSDEFDIVAITACPTGIAHTYMAAKSLEDAAKEMGVTIKVETNGASGIKNKLTTRDIYQAKGVIVAADKKVDMHRFKGKKVIQVPVASGIHQPQELIEKAMNENTEVSNGDVEIKEKGIRQQYTHLMNGISHIIPLLMIYGVLISVVFMFFNNLDSMNTANQTTMSNALLYLASIAMQISFPVLAGFIADSISDHLGFVVAVVASFLSVNLGGNVIEVIIIGFASGYLVKGLNKLFAYLPESIESIVPNILVPIVGTLIMGFIVFYTASFQGSYVLFLSQINNPIILSIIGFVLGLMMSIDLGGPINKTAYTIGIIGIFVGRTDLMSAVMIGGMLPPIVLWLTMLVYPYAFTKEERQAKWRCLVKGLCFVSEEAIPYMIKDKKGIHIPCIIASGIAGALSVLFMCNQRFPHGGIFMLPFIENPFLFILSIIISMLVGMSLILILKKTSHN